VEGDGPSADGAGRVLGRRLVDVGNRDAGAFPRVALGDGAADAARCAGDQGVLPP
jgi:hypothetical protein